jgi:creatinine amidohydrolase
MLSANNTSSQIGQRSSGIAVFGIGAIEQHSVHLPLATDWQLASDIAERVARELDAYLVPALPFSMSQCHGPMPGTVWLKPRTLAALLRDVILSLHAQGVSKIVVVNAHGGNFVLEAEIHRLNLAYPNLIVVMPPLFFEPPPGEPRIWDKGIGIHAEERETSYQLYLNPALVKDDRIDYLPPEGREFLDYAYLGMISKEGVWGYPSCATAEKGEEATRYKVRRIVEWARDTFAQVEALRSRRSERQDARNV